MNLRRNISALMVLACALVPSGSVLRAQDAATANFLRGLSGTRLEVATIVLETVKETNVSIVAVGSWTGSKKYQDPLLGGTSDQDMRVFVPKGSSEEAAQEVWRQTRDKIAEKVRLRYPDKATADKVLSSINLYPPEQVLEGIDDATEALAKLKAQGINPNLGNAEVEGLWGKGSKAFRDAYEVKTGRMIWKEGDVVRSGFADLLPLGETRGLYTIGGSANSATQFAQKVLEAGKAGDARTVRKQLERLNQSLQKARSLGGLQPSNQLDDILKRLNGFGDDIGALQAEFRNNPQLVEQVSQGLRKAELDAELLKRYATSSNPRDVKVLGEMLEEGTGRWARVKSSLSEASAHVPWTSLMHGLMAFLGYLETADIATAAGRGDAEQAWAKIWGNLGFAASLPAGMLSTMVTSILEDAKEAGYAMVVRSQDCEDLIAGIYSVQGREDVPDAQKIETSVDELARSLTTADQVRAVVALHARNASQRDAGAATARADEAVEVQLNARCAPRIVNKWRQRRAAIIGEAAAQLLGAEALFTGTPLTATATPEPVLLTTADGLRGDVTVQARLGSASASLTRALADYSAALSSLGGPLHEVAVSINHSYVWQLDGREIGRDARMFLGTGQVFDDAAARRDITLTATGDHVVVFQYRLEVIVRSTVADVSSARRYLQKTFSPRTTVTVSAVVDTRTPNAAAPPPAADPPPVPPAPAATAPPVAPAETPRPTTGVPTSSTRETSTPVTTADGYWKLRDAQDSSHVSMSDIRLPVLKAQPAVTFAAASITSQAAGTYAGGTGKEVQALPFVQQQVTSWTDLPKAIVPGVTYSTTLKMAWAPDVAPTGGGSLMVPSGDRASVSRTAPQETIKWMLDAPSEFNRVTGQTSVYAEIHGEGPGGVGVRSYHYDWVAGAAPVADAPLAKATKVGAVEPAVVKALTVTLSLAGGSLRVPIGQSLSFRALVSSQDGGPAPNNLVYQWQPNPEAKFTPVEGTSPQASVVFTRPGRTKVWVNVLQPAGAAKATVAASNQLEVDVVAPTLTLRATPAQPYPGQDVRVTLDVTPAAAADLLDFRWEHTGAAINPGPVPGVRAFAFVPKDLSPVAATVFARTRAGGDDAGQATLSVTAREYVVTVTGPILMGPAPRQWDAASGGLTDVGRAFQVFQQAGMKVTLAPVPANVPSYRWMVTPDGCTLSNPSSQTPTISCSRPGEFSVMVMATDALGAVLGAGSQDISVAPQPPVVAPDAAAKEQAAATAAQQAAQRAAQDAAAKATAERQREVEAAKRAQAAAEAERRAQANLATAQRLRDEGTALQQQGKLREAVAKYRESLPYYPDPKLEAIIAQLEAEAAKREKAAQPAPPRPAPAPPAPPAAKPEPMAEAETCQVSGAYEFRSAEGGISLT
ncbi:MAG: hypothetical protein WCQ64_00845, partial [Acidobacteriota bacterium]